LIFLKVDAVYCPNIRSGMRFAVADAYQYRADVPEAELLDILKFGRGQVVQ
jgi:putative phosphoribosyl transferase